MFFHLLQKGCSGRYRPPASPRHHQQLADGGRALQHERGLLCRLELRDNFFGFLSRLFCSTFLLFPKRRGKFLINLEIFWTHDFGTKTDRSFLKLKNAILKEIKSLKTGKLFLCSRNISDVFNSHWGPIHTQYFCTQYWDKKIKRYFFIRYFFFCVNWEYWFLDNYAYWNLVWKYFKIIQGT